MLAGVSLDVPDGAFVSIVGPSGCGKSTLLKVLAGILVPESGSATVGGASTIGRPGLVAYMPQRDLLLPWRRVMANATLAAEVAGLGKREARREAAALMERFGLAGFERAWPSQLSGGMRQRLALLRTYLSPAKTMLLDEPFGALDAITRREMHTWLQEVLDVDASASATTQDLGTRTILFITHDVEEALVLSDTVYVMSPRPGRFVAKVSVPFPRPRRADVVVETEFVRLKAELLRALAAG